MVPGLLSETFIEAHRIVCLNKSEDDRNAAGNITLGRRGSHRRCLNCDWRGVIVLESNKLNKFCVRNNLKFYFWTFLNLLNFLKCFPLSSRASTCPDFPPRQTFAQPLLKPVIFHHEPEPFAKFFLHLVSFRRRSFRSTFRCSSSCFHLASISSGSRAARAIAYAGSFPPLVKVLVHLRFAPGHADLHDDMLDEPLVHRMFR